MSIRRKLLIAAGAAVLPATLVAVTAGSASATNAVPVGPVTCTAKVVLKFSPPLTLTGTGAGTVKAKGVLNKCSDPNAADGIKKIAGKLTATINLAAPASCLGLAVPPAVPTTETFNLNWKGAPATKGAPKIIGASTVTDVGNDAVFDANGNVGFGVPGFQTYGPLADPSNVAGFFAGPITQEASLFSTENSAAVTALCGGKGLKVLHVSGSITLP